MLLEAILQTAEETASLDPENARDNVLQILRTTIARRGEEPPDSDLELIPVFSTVWLPQDEPLVDRLSRGLYTAGDPAMAQQMVSAFGQMLDRVRREQAERRQREEAEKRRQRKEAEARRRRAAEKRRRREEEERRRWRGETFHYNVVLLDQYGNIDQRNSASNRGYTERLEGIALEMANIPAGSFQMGSPSSESSRSSNESPQHSVSVPEFFMGRTQVTQAQWRAVAQLPQVHRSLKSDPSSFIGNELPVENVTWYDCIEFCARLSRATGKNYRLPSEAEWEYACRAGTTTPFHFGETISTEVANYDGNSTYASGQTGVYRQKTTPVGSFNAANAWGLYDMHGNLYEWCLDDWHGSYEGAPSDGRPWFKNDNHSSFEEDWQHWLYAILQHTNNKLLRGGYWYCSPRSCRSANRYYSSPANCDHSRGFRVALSRPRT
jgi:formylglycine-generating enzyme required for sulfatase activity